MSAASRPSFWLLAARGERAASAIGRTSSRSVALVSTAGPRCCCPAPPSCCACGPVTSRWQTLHADLDQQSA